MQIERRRLDSLQLDPDNAREHDKANIDAIKASLEKFGQRKPIVVADGVVIAGNGTMEAAQALGWEEIDTVSADDLDETERRAYAIADNRTAELAKWNQAKLAEALSSVTEDGDAMGEATGFDHQAIVDLVEQHLAETREIVEDEVPEVEEETVTKPGDLWVLGDHRLLCGDSTKAEDVARVMGGEKAVLVHADPPYGMGKEKDGVANDNLYREKLDAFQMAWWKACRESVADNASAYIWGNAPDLWRLWYVGGLSEFERMTIRNEIVWDKGAFGWGQATEAGRCFANYNERCLFFMLGEQGFNINADNYWEGWEPIRAYLVEQFERCGWKTKDVAKWLGVNPRTVDHWISRSQWAFITRESYQRLQELAADHVAFKREHDELKREHDELKREHDELKAAFYATRAHFDNTHDNMTDVWEFRRVTGEDRHGHATPKPVAMICRAVKSSAPSGAIVYEPFLGSGTTLIAAEQLGRKCYGLELAPKYVDVIVKRWQKLTGQRASTRRPASCFRSNL